MKALAVIPGVPVVILRGREDAGAFVVSMKTSP